MELARVVIVGTLSAGADADRGTSFDPAESGLTGAMVTNGQEVLQIIEGGASDVFVALSFVQEDARWAKLRVASSGPASRRVFSDWEVRSVAPGARLQADWMDMSGTELLLMVRRKAAAAELPKEVLPRAA